MEFTVTEKATRPAGKRTQCFYCQQSIGAFHKADCILIQRRVRINCVIRLSYEVDEPVYYTPDKINFHRNEGSWCADNAIPEIQDALEDSCLCPYATFEYVREESEPFLNENGDHKASNPDYLMTL